MNYTELVQSIQDFTENNETTFVAENYVCTANGRINTSVMIPELEKCHCKRNCFASIYSRPNDFLAPFSFTVVDSSNNTTF